MLAGWRAPGRLVAMAEDGGGQGTRSVIAAALAILVVALVLEGLSLRTAVAEAAPLRGRQSWWSFIRTTKKPELAVVLLEDTAAELGLLFALAGVGLAERGVDTLVLERGTVCSGMTARSGALVRMHYTNEPEARMALAGLRYFRSWKDR